MNTKQDKNQEIEAGAYEASAIDFSGSERRFEVPYEAIEKALKEGGVYVLPKAFNGEPLSDYTVKNALRRIRKEIPEANIGYTNTDKEGKPTEQSQVVYYTPKAKAKGA